ncbi:hypothetical protein FQZ97_910190 [compost metagenome]
MICAIASPEPLSVMLTFTPWLFSKVTASMLHQAAWAEQIRLNSLLWACADSAGNSRKGAASQRVFFMDFLLGWTGIAVVGNGWGERFKALRAWPWRRSSAR